MRGLSGVAMLGHSRQSAAFAWPDQVKAVTLIGRSVADTLANVVAGTQHGGAGPVEVADLRSPGSAGWG